MTIINGYAMPRWLWPKHLSIHAYKWKDCFACPESNKKFAKVGIKFERGDSSFNNLFIVFWPKRYIVISWDNNVGCCPG